MPSTGSCARNAGLLDRSERGKLLVSGPGCRGVPAGTVTNDVEALEPGEGQIRRPADRKGHMQADLRVAAAGRPTRSGSTPSRRRSPPPAPLEMYSIGRDVKVPDVGAERAILSLIGPRSVEVAGTAALPEYACEDRHRGRGRVPRGRHRRRAST